ncbi:unnamed protein product, partial [marine sediment metagenome]
EVGITMDGEHTYLRPGMTASVDIVIDTLKDVVFVPIVSIFEYEHKYYCYCMEGSEYVKKEVKLGRSTNENVVVREGIKEGEKITLFEPSIK